MKGQHVRVRGPVFVCAPLRDGTRGYIIVLYAPGQRYEVEGTNLADFGRIDRDQVVTLVGEVTDRINLRPFTRHDGIRFEHEATVVVLRNARVER